ncbi:MAG: sodium:solute symporter family protein [Bacteroidota bacterium]|nr:sodium:solute symporter family protein [Bacteroidota bacterium]
MNWYLFWVIIYVLVILYFTVKHVRHKDVDGYLINNRKTRTLPLVFTTLATFVGGGVCMGLIAMGYTSGLAAVAIGIAYVIGFFILYFFAGKIRDYGAEHNIYSFAEFLNRRYLKKHRTSSFPKTFSGMISGINILIFFFLTAAQFVGMASLLHHAFSVGYPIAAGISFVLVIGYTALAGLSGVIVTDSIQFVVIVFMIAAIFIPGVLSDTNNFTSLKSLDPSMLNGTSEGLLFLLGLPLLLAPSVLTRMDIWQRTLAAKSARTAKRTAWICGLSMLPFYIIFPLVGMALRVDLGAGIDPNHATFEFLAKHTAPVLLGFAVIGLLAALMSSADSFLNIVAMTAVRDFVSWKKNGITKAKSFKYMRIAVFLFGAVALTMALFFANIVNLFVAGITMNILFTPITILALVKKDVYKYKFAAFSSIISGAIVILALFVYGFATHNDSILKMAFIPATLVATIALFIGLWRHKHKGNRVK